MMTPLRMHQSMRRREKMGIPKRPLLFGLAIFMGLGILVYYRLWTIDYRISVDESELLRKQFDLAHREAMDESAEWRSRFDEERERTTKCMKELNELKESRDKMSKDVPDVDERFKRLQSENIDLHERLKSLKQELEAEKLKCKS
ncbi:RING finger protein unkempt-like protein [Bienertia sinuspersici]